MLVVWTSRYTRPYVVLVAALLMKLVPEIDKFPLIDSMRRHVLDGTV